MKRAIKILTIFACLLAAEAILAAVASQEQFKTHLRFNVFAPATQMAVHKNGKIVSLSTVGQELFEALAEEVNKYQWPAAYISKVNVIPAQDNTPDSRRIEFILANDQVELFSFYRDTDQKYVLDFWLESDNHAEKEAPAREVASTTPAADSGLSRETAAVPAGALASVKQEEKAPTESNKDGALSSGTVEDQVGAVAAAVQKDPQKTAGEDKTNGRLDAEKLWQNIIKRQLKREQEKPYRDFRYGASFIWNYAPFSPTPPELINLADKTPEFFYPIQDRDYHKNDRESHLQLIINLYRQEKWGLMNKAMKLFEEKYGVGELDLMDYLKANALLRDNIVKKEAPPIKMAVNIFKSIYERTSNYDLAQALAKYIIAYYLSQDALVDTLEYARNFYTLAMKNFAVEDATSAAEIVLYALAKMEQSEKIDEFLKDKSIIKLVPPQVRLAYQGLVFLNQDRSAEVVKLYEEQAKSLVAPVHPSILYNTAEAYFRLGKFTAAAKLYDQFLVDYAHLDVASFARVRLALSYEILDRDPKDIIALYKNAIDRTVNPDANYEARIRYVAMTSVRQKKPSKFDLEQRVFLENETDRHERIKRAYDPHVLHLLWLVRLRTFLADQDYAAALAYFKAIELDKLSIMQQGVLEADATEIVYGLLKTKFKEGEYAQVVKIWETYRDTYLAKSINDPTINFLVAQGYLKLGLYDGFDQIYARMAKMDNGLEKTFPFWVPREGIDVRSALLELALQKSIKLADTPQTDRLLAQYLKQNPTGARPHYYKGMVEFQKGNYKEAAAELETYLAEEELPLKDLDNVAQILNAYGESLYQSKQYEKFQKVVAAMEQDIAGRQSPYLQAVRERLQHLRLEITAQQGKEAADQQTVVTLADQFTKDFPQSQHKGQVAYLKACALIKLTRVQEGEDILNNLLQDQQTPEYVKSLARSELSLMKIKNRTL